MENPRKMCPLQQPSHQRFALLAPLSSSISSPISSRRLSCVVSAFQRSAVKPCTCAIMTSESLGDEFTCEMWNSAHVWQGKSSVKESTTQVRHAVCRCCSALTVSGPFLFAVVRTIRVKPGTHFITYWSGLFTVNKYKGEKIPTSAANILFFLITRLDFRLPKECQISS